MYVRGEYEGVGKRMDERRELTTRVGWAVGSFPEKANCYNLDFSLFPFLSSLPLSPSLYPHAFLMYRALFLLYSPTNISVKPVSQAFAISPLRCIVLMCHYHEYKPKPAFLSFLFFLFPKKPSQEDFFLSFLTRFLQFTALHSYDDDDDDDKGLRTPGGCPSHSKF